jgi:hypothetical protein
MGLARRALALGIGVGVGPWVGREVGVVGYVLQMATTPSDCAVKPFAGH